MAARETVLKQIEDASKGFEALLNNDLDTAKSILSADKDSAFHLVGLGIAAFLSAVLSREDEEMKRATDTLVAAEQLANAEASARRPKGETAYPAGTEFKLLTGDASIGQALVAIMSESYVEFAKALWKLNKSYKIFAAAFKIVFPVGVEEDEPLDSVMAKLNAHYLKQTTPSAPSVPDSSAGGGFFSSWGRRKGVSAAQNLRHVSSASALVSTTSTSATPAAAPNSASEPGTTVPSAAASMEELPKMGRSSEANSVPAPLWENDPLTTMVISAAALGSGMFGLIFSMMPPKMRKLVSWFGFSNASRPVALKLLTVAASTGNDIHGYFASLVLVTFYCFVLLMSGWQANEQYLLSQCAAVLHRVYKKFPKGSLWRLNRAKLARMSGDADKAIAILKEALEDSHGSFREADSLLVFELSWLYLSQARYEDCATSFERMNTMNGWSPSTYVAISSGALVDAYNSFPSPDLVARLNASFDKLPTLFSMKRVFGEPPVTESFVARKLRVHEAKLARWIAAGKVDKDAKVWEVIRISNAMELGLFWATIGNRSPEAGIRKMISLLASFSPAPRFSPSTSSSAPSASSPPSSLTILSRTTTGSSLTPRLASSSPNAVSARTADDLDSADEVAERDLLLGVLYASLGDPASLLCAQQYLEAVLDAGEVGRIVEEAWLVPFARFHLAVVLGKEGDAEERELGTAATAEQRKGVWRGRIEKAESQLEAVFGVGDYDLKSRLESRVLMLKDEFATKKRMLGL
ncbi:hypothetical protein JCM10213_004928 [Rhodosporidiobolus nylandii]